MPLTQTRNAHWCEAAARQQPTTDVPAFVQRQEGQVGDKTWCGCAAPKSAPSCRRARRFAERDGARPLSSR